MPHASCRPEFNSAPCGLTLTNGGRLITACGTDKTTLKSEINAINAVGYRFFIRSTEYLKTKIRNPI
jgi:hypothetical protein